jgi:hypothetical protein
MRIFYGLVIFSEFREGCSIILKQFVGVAATEVTSEAKIYLIHVLIRNRLTGM